MFAGMIQEVGIVGSAAKRAGGLRLEVRCPKVAAQAAVGDSISVDGACLTVETLAGGGFAAFASGETLSKTTLKGMKRGDKVNLEQALKLGEKIGGHLVQGHVEAVAEVASLGRAGEGAALSIRLPEEMLEAVAPKGSIAISGVSLTVARVEGRMVEIAVIPHTLKSTTLGELSPGSLVNVESDLIARHVVAYLKNRAGKKPPARDLDPDEMGF